MCLTFPAVSWTDLKKCRTPIQKDENSKFFFQMKQNKTICLILKSDVKRYYTQGHFEDLYEINDKIPMNSLN